MGHKNSHDDLSPEYIKIILAYSPESGELRWAKSMPPRGRIGQIAGRKDTNGRIKVGIHGTEYMAHRLIWLWMCGQWPEKEIDHINEDQSDNRWENLREATPSQNHRNRGKQRNNTTGYKGVTFDKRRGVYIAGVKLNQRRYSAGNSFQTAEEAYEAVKKLALTLHGDWSKYT